MVYRYLVGDSRELLLPRVSADEVVRTHAPSEVDGVSRPNRAREPQSMELLHRSVLVRAGREVNVLVEKLGSETLAEIVEGRGSGGLAHQGMARDVLQAVASAEYLN